MLGKIVTIAIVGLFFLQTSGIRQEDLQQIRSAARTVNWSSKTVLDQARQITRMIDVCVSDENRVQRTGIERRLLPISFPEFFQNLKEPAIHKHSRLFSIEQ